MMKKEWFVKVDNRESGPFSIQDLKHDPRVNPDTLVRRIDQLHWTPMRFVLELKEVFEDEPVGTPLHETGKTPLNVNQDLATLAIQQDPSQFFLWMLILLIIFIYTLYRLYA